MNRVIRPGREPDRWLRRQRLRRRLRGVSLFGLTALVVFGFWIVWFSPWLAVTKLSVISLDRQLPDQAQNDVIVTSGISMGVPLARIDAEQATIQLEEVAWIDQAEVRRVWPDAVVIAVAMRQPVARGEPSELFDYEVEPLAVDQNGVLFSPPGGWEEAGPILRGDRAAFGDAVRVLMDLPEDLASKVRIVQAVSSNDIRLQLRDEAIVRWGDARDGELKARVLKVLLDEKAEGYDVSTPDLPAIFETKSNR